MSVAPTRSADLAAELKRLEPRREFLIGIDSDGCAFDTMEIKQKTCFCPNNIAFFGLQAVAGCVREATDFVNLYSKYRGTNRYPAIVKVMDLLRTRREVLASGVKVPELNALRQWIRQESQLSKGNLCARVEQTNDPELRNVLAWSEAVDADIAQRVKQAPPFPFVCDALEKASRCADILVVSQTPLEALRREWTQHGLDRLVRFIAGQEHGTKTEQLTWSAGGKYPSGHVLMIGDAQGDLTAARESGAVFYPIVPGSEAQSWRRFLDESLDLFLAGSYTGDYESALLHEFHAALPENPRW